MSEEPGDDVVHLMTEAGCKISINGQGHLPCSAHPYARCTEEDCGLEFVNREAMSAHLKETVAPTTTSKVFTTGLLARGHRATVVNPTPEEQQASRVRSAIDSALDDLYSELDRELDRGRFTQEEVREGLRWFDLSDGWDSYIEEGGG